ncbi:MAG: hypothetical protein ACRCYJ_18605 [Plesiomonas shigelloides]
MNDFTSLALEAIDLYETAITRRVEAMPELKHLCEEEMERVLAVFPSEVLDHILKMKSLTAQEYINWASQCKS